MGEWHSQCVSASSGTQSWQWFGSSGMQPKNLSISFGLASYRRSVLFFQRFTGSLHLETQAKVQSRKGTLFQHAFYSFQGAHISLILENCLGWHFGDVRLHQFLQADLILAAMLRPKHVFWKGHLPILVACLKHVKGFGILQIHGTRSCRKIG